MIRPENTINMTPHAIVFYPQDCGQPDYQEKFVFPPSGLIARVEEKTQPSVHEGCVRKVYSNPSIPPFQNAKYVIVSSMVLSALKDSGIVSSSLFIAPDTGSGAVRDKDGKIIGTKCFVALE